MLVIKSVSDNRPTIKFCNLLRNIENALFP
nr:MAG TPA: hypothetical protein [Caudoviricetes sp.]